MTHQGFACSMQFSLSIVCIKQCVYLLCVELVQLCLLTIPPPEAQHFRFGTVSHVDEFLIPPTFIHSSNVAPQHDAIITYLGAHNIT